MMKRLACGLERNVKLGPRVLDRHDERKGTEVPSCHSERPGHDS